MGLLDLDNDKLKKNNAEFSKQAEKFSLFDCLIDLKDLSFVGKVTINGILGRSSWRNKNAKLAHNQSHRRVAFVHVQLQVPNDHESIAKNLMVSMRKK